MPVRSSMVRARRSLLARLTAANFCWNAGSSACARRPLSWSRSSRQPVPSVSSSSADRPGLASDSQRRGVTPLVMLVKRSGHMLAKSAKMVCTSRSECSAETPLTLWLPTIDRCAMRTRRSPCSSISDSRARKPLSPGRWRAACSRNSLLIRKMISRWRGSTCCISATVQVSSASGISVWLVYEKVSRQIAQAWSQAMPCSSHSTRISSATPIAGWVSLRWIATLSAKLSSDGCLLQVAGHHVLDRRGDEEVLLLQAQFAPGRRAVVRVQHPGDVLVFVLGAGGAGVVAGVEGAQVDVRRRGRLPQPQRADLAVAVAGDHHVVGLGDDLGGMAPVHLAVDVFDPAAETHRIGDLRAREFPGRAVRQPGVGVLHLAAVLDLLREHAVFVADAVAERGQADAWPSNPGNRPPAAPGRHCPAPRRVPGRPRLRACGRIPAGPGARRRRGRARPAHWTCCVRSGIPSTGSRPGAPCSRARAPRFRPSAATAAHVRRATGPASVHGSTPGGHRRRRCVSNCSLMAVPRLAGGLGTRWFTVQSFLDACVATWRGADRDTCSGARSHGCEQLQFILACPCDTMDARAVPARHRH